MAKVLLISNKLFQYRIGVYNFFYKSLEQNSIKLKVIADEIQQNIDINIDFPYIIKKLNFFSYIKFLRNEKPDVVIIYLHLRNLIIFPLIFWLKLKRIPFIYWGHGINLQDPNNKIKNYLFNYLHNIATTILLYTPDQIKYIKPKNRKKIFIANNTLNFERFPVITQTKQDLRKIHNIEYDKILIYVSRILPYKKVDVLINIFEKLDNKYGLLIIGDGMPKELNERIKEHKNIKYFGAVYDKQKVNELFKLSDIFCIPGANGLSINQAMYWGLPCLALDVLQGPEVWYIKQGETGYIVQNEKELKEKILQLFKNETELKRLSDNSYKLMRTEGSIDKMFEGFYNAIKYNIDANKRNRKKNY